MNIEYNKTDDSFAILIDRLCLQFSKNVNPKFSISGKKDYYQVDFWIVLFGLGLTISYITCKYQ
jgi:hypothetical protein